MGIFSKIGDYFNREIQLNKEYYESLKEEKSIVFDKTPSNKGHKCTNNLYEQAVDIIFEHGQASASILERHLKISFNAASEILNHLVSKGIISELNGSTPRKILVNNVSQAKEMLNRPISKSQPIKDFDPGTQVRTDTTTVYYAYGHVQKVLPPLLGSYYENRDIINAATFIVSDGVAYDLTDIQSIRSIKIPNYHIYAPNKVGEELGVTGCLDYVLRMRSGLYWREGNFDLSIACLEKATELMKYSSVGWPPKDFFRIVNELNDLGRFKRAEKWKAWIEHNIPDATSAIAPIAATMESREPLSSQQRKELLEGCKYLDTDLVEVGDSGVCCEVCAKYRNRIYTLTGKDSRFLRFPKDFHKSCGLSVYPYIWGVHEPVFSCSDPVSYSNRPFSDDRTAEEKANREKWLQKMTQQPEVLKTPSLTRIIYYRLKQILPDDSPKSLSGFSRMRKSNSKNYQALVKKAEAAGFVFPQTLDDVAKWPENQ